MQPHYAYKMKSKIPSDEGAQSLDQFRSDEIKHGSHYNKTVYPPVFEVSGY